MRINGTKSPGTNGRPKVRTAAIAVAIGDVASSPPIAIPDELPCPSCGESIALSTLLTSELQRSLEQHQQQKVDADLAAREDALRQEREALEEERDKLRETLKTAQRARAETARLQQEIEDARLQIQAEADERMLKEAQQIRAQERIRAEREADQRLKARDREMKVLEQRLREAETAELRLRTESTQLDARRNAIELEIARRVDSLRETLAQQITEKAQQTASIEVKRREEEINRLREQIAKLNVRPGPTELVGETLEKIVKSTLLAACVLDEIADVPRGRAGGDLIHEVRNAAGVFQGRILWEVKCTKSFDGKWISKLKASQREANCDVAILVTVALPKEITHFGLYEDVWVCSTTAVPGIACLVRHALSRINTARTIASTQEARLASMAEYLTSTSFRLGCESLVNLIGELEKQLQAEERNLQRAWQRRRHVTAGLSQGIVSMLGSLEGAIGSDLAPSLEYADRALRDSLPEGT